VQTKVEAVLKLAERVIDHLNAIAFRGGVGSERAVWCPCIYTSVGSTSYNCCGHDAVSGAARQEIEGHCWTHASVVPFNVERLADGGIGGSGGCGDGVVGELSKGCLLASSTDCRDASCGNDHDLGEHFEGCDAMSVTAGNGGLSMGQDQNTGARERG